MIGDCIAGEGDCFFSAIAYTLYQTRHDLFSQILQDTGNFEWKSSVIEKKKKNEKSMTMHDLPEGVRHRWRSLMCREVKMFLKHIHFHFITDGEGSNKDESDERLTLFYAALVDIGPYWARNRRWRTSVFPDDNDWFRNLDLIKPDHVASCFVRLHYLNALCERIGQERRHSIYPFEFQKHLFVKNVLNLDLKVVVKGSLPCEYGSRTATNSIAISYSLIGSEVGHFDLWQGEHEDIDQTQEKKEAPKRRKGRRTDNGV